MTSVNTPETKNETKNENSLAEDDTKSMSRMLLELASVSITKYNCKTRKEALIAICNRFPDFKDDKAFEVMFMIAFDTIYPHADLLKSLQ